MGENAEIEGNGSADEGKKDNEKLALLTQIGGAGLEDDIAYLQHSGMGLETMDFSKLPASKQETKQDYGESPIKDAGT